MKSLQEKLEMKKLYESGINARKIGEIYNLAPQNITYHLKNIMSKNEYDIATQKVRSKTRIKYECDRNHFNEIDKPNKAYVLGFIYGDGSVNKSNLSISITDISLLKKIKKELNSQHPIKKYKHNESTFDIKKQLYGVYIGSYKMVNDLKNLGVIENKTFKINKIPNIPLEFYPDFIRGYFDADGSVWYYTLKDGYMKIAFEVCGNRLFIEDIRNFLCDNGFYKAKLFMKGIKTYYLRYSGFKNAFNFYNLIYYDGNIIYLERKKKRFEEYFIKKSPLKKVGRPKKLI